jgi:hypothetical protein
VPARKLEMATQCDRDDVRPPPTHSPSEIVDGALRSDRSIWRRRPASFRIVVRLGRNRGLFGCGRAPTSNVVISAALSESSRWAMPDRHVRTQVDGTFVFDHIAPGQSFVRDVDRER